MAPILIFIMISSLAIFLLQILYRGDYPARAAWVLLMFTMGSVSVARIAIEQDRQYSIGYALALGAAAFFVLIGYLSNPLFCLLLLGVIGYLADRIVHDCTLIDDSQDASGQGLIDVGGSFLKDLKNQSTNAVDIELDKEEQSPEKSEAESKKEQRRKKREGHQPGRTVMYLALGALPLFGIGQFMLRGDATSWGTAQRHLMLYLFSALSLLVTTSFLGLRRYLRQRDADMPVDVSVAWIGGGLSLIGLILGIAFLAPLPGKALASIEVPEFLKTPDKTASEYGWGDEAAKNTSEGAATTANDKNPDDKDVESYRTEKGAKPGDTGDGQKDKGPKGKQSGGKQSGGEKDKNSKSKSQSKQSSPQQKSDAKQKSQAKQNQQSQDGKQPEQKNDAQKQSQKGDKPKGAEQQKSKSQQQEQSQQSKSNDQQNRKQSDQKQSDQKQSDQKQSDQKQSDQKQSDQKQSDQKQSDQKQSDQKQSDQKQSDQKQSDQKQSDKEQEQSDQRKADEQKDEREQEEQSDQQNESKSKESSDRQKQSSDSDKKDDSNDAQSKDQSSNKGSNPLKALGNLISMIAGALRFIIMIALACIVGYYVWKNRDAIMAWWERLFQRDRDIAAAQASDEIAPADLEAPPIPFSRFKNPIGKERDPRKVVVITFQAFDAWAREQGVKREKDETPSEFIRRIASSLNEEASSATRIVDAYNRIVYGRGKATQDDLDAAGRTWSMMNSRKSLQTPLPA